MSGLPTCLKPIIRLGSVSPCSSSLPGSLSITSGCFSSSNSSNCLSKARPPISKAALEIGGLALLKQFELFDEEKQPLVIDKLPGRLELQGETEPSRIIGFRQVGKPDIHWATIKAS